jgi:hypothetical protein
VGTVPAWLARLAAAGARLEVAQEAAFPLFGFDHWWQSFRPQYFGKNSVVTDSSEEARLAELAFAAGVRAANASRTGSSSACGSRPAPWCGSRARIDGIASARQGL